MPPPKLPQPSGAVHSIWWLGFFLTSSPILDLEHFSQVILRIVLQIMPTPQINPNHQVLFTASDGWVFFWPFSYSGRRAFFFLWIVLQIMPPQIILDLEHFSQVILRIVVQIMPPPKLPQPSGAVPTDFHKCTTPPKLTQPSGAVHSIWWLGVFFWPLLLFWT